MRVNRKELKGLPACGHLHTPTATSNYRHPARAPIASALLALTFRCPGATASDLAEEGKNRKPTAMSSSREEPDNLDKHMHNCAKTSKSPPRTGNSKSTVHHSGEKQSIVNCGHGRGRRLRCSFYNAYPRASLAGCTAGPLYCTPSRGALQKSQSSI
jgi:hypothetical protein